MGFNKRILNRRNVTHIYETQGIEGLYNYIKKPDALFVGDCGDIVDVIGMDMCDTKKDLKIKKLLYGETTE
jgi:hypothetical protein